MSALTQASYDGALDYTIRTRDHCLAAVPSDRRSTAASLPAPALSTEVVVLTQDSEADLVRSLPAIRRAARAAQAELLFVDLGSTDATKTYAAKHVPNARGVWLERTDGLGDALSAAAAASSADVLVLISPTVEPASADGIAALVRHLDEHPYAAVAAPVLQSHAGDVLRSTYPSDPASTFARVELVLGEAIAVRRSDIQDLAARTRNHSKLGEFELCIKLRRRGRELHYLPSVRWLDSGGRAAARISSGPPPYVSSVRRLMLRHPRHALRMLSARRHSRHAAQVLRRSFDIVVSAMLLVLLSPLLAGIAIATKLDSPGPALFRQRRLGRKAVPFEMYKFRTMRHNADPGLHRDFVCNMIVNRLRGDGEAQVFKVYPDPRVTRLGRLLRRTSLDELPQLINVLKGDMTLVGFRPPIPYEVDQYPDWYFRRFDTKPGITGLWQVSGRNERSYEEMVRLDIEYLNRRSWMLDVALLARTVTTVISGRGAY